MAIVSDRIISISDATKSFNKVIKIAKKTGEAIIFKHNKPAYIVIDIEKMSDDFMKEFEQLKVKYLSTKIMDEYSEAYHELAK